jgi:hypothetical protein
LIDSFEENGYNFPSQSHLLSPYFKKTFEAIANNSGGTRAAGTPGYNASGSYSSLVLLFFC